MARKKKKYTLPFRTGTAEDVISDIDSNVGWQMNGCDNIKNQEMKEQCKALAIQNLIEEYYSKLYRCSTMKCYNAVINKIAKLKEQWEKHKQPGMSLPEHKFLPNPPAPSNIPSMGFPPPGIPANIR